MRPTGDDYFLRKAHPARFPTNPIITHMRWARTGLAGKADGENASVACRRASWEINPTVSVKLCQITRVMWLMASFLGIGEEYRAWVDAKKKHELWIAFLLAIESNYAHDRHRGSSEAALFKTIYMHRFHFSTCSIRTELCIGYYPRSAIIGQVS